MKKICLSIFATAILGFAAKAQLSDGGLPQSMQASLKYQSYVPVQHYTAPDWNSFITKNDKEEQAGLGRPYRVALPLSLDIGFPSSGSFTDLPDGSRIWRTQIKVENAPAISLYYDNFRLPEGVKMYLSNNRQNQILGAYTSSNNTEEKVFVNEPTLGETVNIELDIAPNVNLNDVQLHADRALVYFRSYEYLNKYKQNSDTRNKPTDPDVLGLEGGSSTCEINAICPLGQNYPKQRKSTIQIVHKDGFLCSATLINNTGNTASNCKNYLLTATHCEPENDTSGLVFSQMVVRFNFEKSTCGTGPDAEVNTLFGVKFKARANYIDSDPPTINGDFLLVQVNSAIPAGWDVYMTGWNRATTMPSNLVYPKRYIGFHHPAGDVKKVTTYHNLNPNGEAGGSLGAGTHWAIPNFDSGGIEQGSSGSGLFDGDGHQIGIASVAGNPNANCGVAGNGQQASFLRFVEYAKFSLAWDYAQDGAFNNRMLKPWLDPTNSGVMTLEPTKSNCSDFTPPTTGITNNRADLQNSIKVYPNPATSGIVTAQVNFASASDLDVTIFDISGAKKGSYHLKKVLNGVYTFDLSNYSNGMYLLRFDNEDGSTTKKIMLSK